MIIREKCPADGPDCEALLRVVHRCDGYPRHLPDDVPRFVTAAQETDGWVAVRGGVVVGHVALHHAGSDPTLAAARRATGLPAERLAVVARLLVDPAARREGIGRALLETATERARSRGQQAVLDVVQEATAPLRLYERSGWTRLEPLTLHLAHGRSLDLWVYLAPAASGAQP